MRLDDNRIRTPRVTVQLYMKPGCHLCEQVEADLEQLRRRYPHRLEHVDITSEPELMQRYAEAIPVLVIQQREYAAPLSASRIERALAEAAARPEASGGP